jgi:peptidoglycan/LPS O-acetylase OafA/YrhL
LAEKAPQVGDHALDFASGPGEASTLQVQNIPALTGLRFFAAFSILFGHTVGWTTPFTTQSPITTVGDVIQYYGMPLFFVLSGFVIHLNYARLFHEHRFGWAASEFFIARLARLYPLYFCAFVFGVFSDFTFNWLAEFPLDFWAMLGFGLSMTRSWIYLLVVNHRLLLEHAFGLGWSVSTEWFFYIVYMGLVFAVVRLRSARATLVSLGVFSLAAFAAVIVVQANYGRILAVASKDFASVAEQTPGPYDFHQWLFYYSPYLRVLEFVLGCLTAQLYVRLYNRPVARAEQRAGTIALWTALAVLVTVGVVSAEFRLPAPYAAYFNTLILNFGLAVPIAVVMFCTARYSGAVAGFLGSAPLVRLGDLSYSIYAVHTWTLRPLIRPPVPYDTTMAVDAALRIPLAIVVTIAVATATYRLIEVPSRAYIRKHLSQAMARHAEKTAAASAASPA